MSDMTESRSLIVDPALVAARYVAVWEEPDARLRRAAIIELWASEGVQFVEGAQFHGHEELVARVTHAHTEFVDSGEYTVADAGDATGHDDIVMFTIQLVSARDRRVAWAARVFLLLDQDCRIRADYQLTVQPLAA